LTATSLQVQQSNIPDLECARKGDTINIAMASYQVCVPKITCHHRLICPRKDGRECSMSESHKSVSYQTETEWGRWNG
jgi:hypothetical protein